MFYTKCSEIIPFPAPTPRPVSAPKSPGNYAPTYQPTESEDRRLAGAPTLRGSYSV